MNETIGIGSRARRQPEGVIRRGRLLAHLEERSPLTVIRGPAGSGKTTLVNQYLEKLRSAAVRVSARHGACEVRAALAQASSITAVEVLVIEDLDRSDEVTQLEDEVLESLLTDPQLRVIVTTSSPGYLERGLVGAKVNTVFISPEALMLTPDETSQIIAAGSGGPAADRADETLLYELAEGSPLLLRAVMHGLQNRTPGESIREACVAVGNDLLRQVDETANEFLLSSCVTEEFDLVLAEQLAGREVDQVLNVLQSQGLLLRREDGGSPRWRYPRIVRQALLERTAQRVPAAMAESHRLAARWHLERQRPDDALFHAVEAGDLGLASAVLVAHGVSMAHRDTIFDQLIHLKPKELRRFPMVAFAVAGGSFSRRSQRLKARAYFLVAATGAKRASRTGGDAQRAALAAVESISLRMIGEPQKGLSAARRALRIVEDPDADLVQLYDQVGWLRLQVGLSLIRCGHPDEAWEALGANLAVLVSLPPSVAMQTLGTAAYLHAREGDLKSAREIVDAAQQLDIPDEVREGFSSSQYRLARAMLSLEKLDPQAVRAEVQSMAPFMEFLEYRPHFVALEALADMLSGRTARGLQRIETFMRSQRRMNFIGYDLSTLGPSYALLYLADGQDVQAEMVMEHLSEPDDRVLFQIFRALMAHFANDPDTIGIMAGFDPAASSPRAAALAHAVWAATALRQNDSETTSVHVQHLIAIAAETSLCLHLALLPAGDVQHLYQFAKENALEGAELLDAAGVPAVMPPRRNAPRLTEREQVVLHALAQHSRASDIAETLVVSPNTVKSQLNSLYQKLQVTNRKHALAAAHDYGLLRIREPQP